MPPEARLYPFAEAHTRDANAHDDGNGGGNDDDGGVGVVATGQGGGEDGGGPGVAVVELDFRGELKRYVVGWGGVGGWMDLHAVVCLFVCVGGRASFITLTRTDQTTTTITHHSRLQALLVARIPALLFALRTDALAATSQTSPSPSPPQPAATAGAAGPGPGGHGHAALLGEVVQAVDNMHDVLSAYRQHQVRVGWGSICGFVYGGFGVGPWCCVACVHFSCLVRTHASVCGTTHDDRRWCRWWSAWRRSAARSARRYRGSRGVCGVCTCRNVLL